VEKLAWRLTHAGGDPLDVTGWGLAYSKYNYSKPDDYK
jgi:hypothetical protein